jgi:hypothetical protein
VKYNLALADAPWAESFQVAVTIAGQTAPPVVVPKGATFQVDAEPGTEIGLSIVSVNADGKQSAPGALMVKVPYPDATVPVACTVELAPVT